jgi:cell division protein FtsB
MKRFKTIFALSILLFIIFSMTTWTAFSLYIQNLELSNQVSVTKASLNLIISENEKFKKTISELNISLKEKTNETNNLLSALVAEYSKTLNKTVYHLTLIWEDKNKDIWVKNYKLNGGLFHLEHIMGLLKHAYWLVLPYKNNSKFFESLSKIMCNNTLGDIISALQLVYGHIYAFNVPLGSHPIDVNLLVWTKSHISKIVEIVSKVRINGLPPDQQITQDEFMGLLEHFENLKEVVQNYLSKPGTVIS